MFVHRTCGYLRFPAGNSLLFRKFANFLILAYLRVSGEPQIVCFNRIGKLVYVQFLFQMVKVPILILTQDLNNI